MAVSHPEVTFAICGEGEMLDALRDAAASLGDRLRFLGWRADVETVYAATDVVTLCSDNEGMPVSLIEAALAGVPAVATRVGSVGEVVLDGRSGVLTGTSPGEIAAAVGQLLADDNLRARMGKAAREHATASFSQSRLVTDTERLYEELIDEKGLRSR
jgi:glycosyltransferase involved in cell wall biosynthesis